MDYRKLYFADPEKRNDVAEKAIHSRNNAIRTVIEETLKLNATKEIYYPQEINGLCRASYWVGDYSSISPGKRILLLGEHHKKIKRNPNVLDLLNFYVEQTPLFLDIFVEDLLKYPSKEELTEDLMNAVRGEFSEKCNRENLPFRYHRFDVRNLFSSEKTEDLIRENKNFRKEITKPNGFILFLKNESNRNSHIRKEKTKVSTFLKKRIEDFILDEFQSIYDEIFEKISASHQKAGGEMVERTKKMSSKEVRAFFDFTKKEYDLGDDFDEEEIREGLLRSTIEGFDSLQYTDKRGFEKFLLGKWNEDPEMEAMLHAIISRILGLLTDWYCLLRLFKPFDSQIHPKDSNNCIIYGGDDHIQRYERFFSQNGFAKEYESIEKDCNKITLPETPPLFEI